MTVHVLQITDLHLFANPGERLKGVPTRETLHDVLQHARGLNVEFDAVVVSGDLTHDERRESYLAVRIALDDWVPRCLIIPGNHDERALIREVFPEIVPAGEGTITFSQACGEWQLIGLDTHSPGEVPGRIAREQLDWLDGELDRCRNRPAALFLHHPPVPVNCPWLDRIGLQDPDLLLEILTGYEHIRFISAGHVHHEFECTIGSAAFMTTPSTGVQFIPSGEEPAYDSVPPGYRTFQLDADGYETQVRRVGQLRFPPVA